MFVSGEHAPLRLGNGYISWFSCLNIPYIKYNRVPKFSLLLHRLTLIQGVILNKPFV